MLGSVSCIFTRGIVDAYGVGRWVVTKEACERTESTCFAHLVWSHTSPPLFLLFFWVGDSHPALEFESDICMLWEAIDAGHITYCALCAWCLSESGDDLSAARTRQSHYVSLAYLNAVLHPSPTAQGPPVWLLLADPLGCSCFRVHWKGFFSNHVP